MDAGIFDMFGDCFYYDHALIGNAVNFQLARVLNEFGDDDRVLT